MLLLVLILVLLAFGLLLIALFTGSVLWAWVSVAVSIVAGAVLLVDELQRRSAVRAGAKAFEPVTGHTPGDDSLRSLPARSDIESVTEIIPVIPPTAGAPGDRGTSERVQPDTVGRFDPAADTQQTVVMPIVQPSGSADLPSGATSRITPSSGKPSRTVAESGDRAAPQHPLFEGSTAVGADPSGPGRPSSDPDPTLAVQPTANVGPAGPGPEATIAATPARPAPDSPDPDSSVAFSRDFGPPHSGPPDAGSPDPTSPSDGSRESGSPASDSSRAEFAPSGSGPVGLPAGSTRRPGSSEPGSSEPGSSEPGSSEPGSSGPGSSAPGGAAEATAVVAAHPATVSGGPDAAMVGDRPGRDGSDDELRVDPDRGPDRDDLGRAEGDDSEPGPADAGPSSDSHGPAAFIGADGGGGDWRADEHETAGSSVSAEVDADPAEAPPPDAEPADVDYSEDADDPPEEPFDPVAATVVAMLEDEVVVIDERPRYHLAECGSLGDNELIPLPAREAVELGFTPCGWCSPDRTLAGRHTASAR